MNLLIVKFGKYSLKGSTKYAIAERLGNYIDPESNILQKFPSIDPEDAFFCSSFYKDESNDYGIYHLYQAYCIYKNYEGCKVLFL